jgi:hypothetical protein
MSPEAAKSGRDPGTGVKSQHVDLFRKLKLRRELCEKGGAGAAYVPFIGDGDIAAELYADRIICGADLDPVRVATSAARFPTGDIRVGDCDGYPFADRTDLTFAIADFDSYSNPYAGLSAFWPVAKTTDRVVIFGTDGHKQTISRKKLAISLPSGKTNGQAENFREMSNFWWPRYVLPFLTEFFAPAVIVEVSHYYRGPFMLYWGIIVDRDPNATVEETEETADPMAAVEAALLEAATSGNVAAMNMWLERQDRRDAERRARLGLG